MSADPDLDDARRQVRDTLDGLAAVTRVEVHRGPRHETCDVPGVDDPDGPVAVLDEPAVVTGLVGALASADPSDRVVVPVLGGLTLHLLAGDDLVGVLDALSPRWVRGFWPYDARLASPLPLAGVDVAGGPWDPWVDDAVAAALAGAGVAPSPRAHALTTAWAARRPGQQPVASTLRPDDRRVRFHSLPGSQRYPHDEVQLAEVLARHRTVLDALVAADAADGRDVVVVTASWSGGSRPVPLRAPVAAALPGAGYWTSVRTDEDPETRTSVWAHLFVDVVDLDDPGLDRLLRVVAAGQASEVLVMPPDPTWLYAPYDGGADALAATRAQRDEIAARHAAWLSAGGL